MKRLFIIIAMISSLISASANEDYIPVFQKIFQEMKVRTLMEFGYDYSSQYFLEECTKVISIEFVTNGCGPEKRIKIMGNSIFGESIKTALFRKYLSFALVLISSLSFAESEIPEPYKSIKLLPAYYHGFYSNSWQLEFLIKIHHVKTVIEVGSWLGTSTMHMASLIPADGKIYAVDHWKGSIEHQEGQQNWIPQLSYLYDQFLSNVVHAGFANKIIPYRMDSLSAAKILGFIHPDLIYIDASHDTESVYEDLRAWYPYVEEHGILCGDDWRAPSVQEALNRFAKEKELRIVALENFWYLD